LRSNAIGRRDHLRQRARGHDVHRLQHRSLLPGLARVLPAWLMARVCRFAYLRKGNATMFRNDPGIQGVRRPLHCVSLRPDRMTLRVALAAAPTALGVVIAPPAIADAGCGPGRPPPGAASEDVSDVYGQPATLWLTNQIVGIATAQGYGEAAIHSPSPLQRS